MLVEEATDVLEEGELRHRVRDLAHVNVSACPGVLTCSAQTADNVLATRCMRDRASQKAHSSEGSQRGCIRLSASCSTRRENATQTARSQTYSLSSMNPQRGGEAQLESIASSGKTVRNQHRVR